MTDLRAFCMPKWGIEMTEGTLAEWMVSEGDAFKKGDLLCLIETDKITNEVEAEKDGVVERIVVKAGGDAEAVGSLLAGFSGFVIEWTGFPWFFVGTSLIGVPVALLCLLVARRHGPMEASAEAPGDAPNRAT